MWQIYNLKELRGDDKGMNSVGLLMYSQQLCVHSTKNNDDDNNGDDTNEVEMNMKMTCG